jgi:hypothetical protein
MPWSPLGREAFVPWDRLGQRWNQLKAKISLGWERRDDDQGAPHGSIGASASRGDQSGGELTNAARSIDPGEEERFAAAYWLIKDINGQ